MTPSVPVKTSKPRPAQPQVQGTIYGALSLENPEDAEESARMSQVAKIRAPHRALPHHHLSWVGACSATAGLLPGCGIRSTKPSMFPGPA